MPETREKIQPDDDGYIIVRSKFNGPRRRYRVEQIVESSADWITFDGWRVNLGNGKPTYNRKRYSFHRTAVNPPPPT